MLTFEASALCRGKVLTNMERASVTLFLTFVPVQLEQACFKCTMYSVLLLNVIFKTVIQICKVIWNK